MTRAVPHVAAMSPYALADPAGDGIVSLAQNESAFPPSPAAIRAGTEALRDSALYPDPHWRDLRAAIAAVHGLDPESILCGAGSMDLIGALIHAFAGPGDTVLGSAHGYAYAATACARSGPQYVTVPEPGMAVSASALAEAVAPRTRVVFLCNPGNPTGTLISNAKIIELRNDLPDDVLLVVDQAYGEFADMAQNRAEVFALAERGNTVILRSLSKAYGLAGARVGWGLVPPGIGAELRKVLNPSNVAAASQAMAAAAMRDQTHMLETVAATSDIRDRFAAAMRGIGLSVPPSYTNFVLLQFPTPDVAAQADLALRQNGLLLRGMGDYGLPDCLRATICGDDVMDRVTAVLTAGMT